MNCLPPWFIKCFAPLIACLYTQTPQDIPVREPVTTSIHQPQESEASEMSSTQESAEQNPILLPTELHQEIIKAIGENKLTLKKKMKYYLSMRTVNKSLYTTITPTIILDWCEISSAPRATTAFTTVIKPCPMIMARALITHGADINQLHEMINGCSSTTYQAHTLIQKAVIDNDAQLVGKLLLLGANPNIKNKLAGNAHTYAINREIKALLAPYQ